MQSAGHARIRFLFSTTATVVFLHSHTIHERCTFTRTRTHTSAHQAAKEKKNWVNETITRNEGTGERRSREYTMLMKGKVVCLVRVWKNTREGGEDKNLHTIARHLRWATASATLRICIYRKRAFDGLLWRIYGAARLIGADNQLSYERQRKFTGIIIYIYSVGSVQCKGRRKRNRLKRLTCAHRQGNLIWSLSLMQWGYYFDTDYGFPFLSLLQSQPPAPPWILTYDRIRVNCKN